VVWFRTDLFKETDPWEALPSDNYVRQCFGLRKGVLEDELDLNNKQAFIRQHSEACYINCWQIFEGETVHMWDIYGKGDGVMIFSTFARLKAAVDAFLDPVLLGKVKYTEKGRQGYNLIDFLFTKRSHFEKERELRVVVQSYNPMAGANRHYDESNFPHREPLDDLYPLPAWVHKYKRRRIDLKDLVTEIRLSPWVSTAMRDEINLWKKHKNLSCSITESELTSALTPTPDELKRLCL
jgi:hypothetical protein